MCLTSGKLFMQKQSIEHRSADKINESAIIEEKPK